MTDEKIHDFQRGLAENIRKHREAIGISQRELGRRTGISQSTLSQIERKGYPLSFQNIYLLAHVLGTTFHGLVPATSEDVTAHLK